MTDECQKCLERNIQPQNKERVRLLHSELSVRATRALMAAGIEYVDELPNLSSREILKWRNFGKKSLDAIREFLAKNNLSLKDETVNPDIQQMILKDLPEILNHIRRQVDEAIQELRYFSFKLEQISIDTQKKSEKLKK